MDFDDECNFSREPRKYICNNSSHGRADDNENLVHLSIKHIKYCFMH